MEKWTQFASADDDLSRIQAKAKAYAVEAGRIVLASFGGSLDITYKSKRGRNPVTGVDKEVESFLHAAISRDFPGHGILGEEGTGIGVEEADFLWVLDPLDGTTNYINRLPFFAVSIGVLHRLEPVAAAVFSPQTHLGRKGVFHAAKGGGAYLDDVSLRIENDGEPEPGRLASVPGSYGRRFSSDDELKKRQGEPRVVGCVALEMALAAAGVFQFAVFGAPKIWDVAAGTLIVREAGGTVLVGSQENGRWADLGTFALSEGDRTGQADALRKWARPVLAGSPRIVDFVSQHLTVRPRSGAKGRSGSSRAGGKKGSRG